MANQVVRDVFTTPDDLATKVTAAIGAYLNNRAYPPDGNRISVERITDVTAPEVMAALNLFTRRIPDQDRVEQLLRFIYQDLYPEEFSPIAHENVSYRAYLNEFFVEQVTLVPDRVRLLRSLEVRRGRTV